MSTESTIVMRARTALKTNKKIEIEVPEHITTIQFKFMRGLTCYGIEDWYDFCRNNGMVDIKMSAPSDAIERNPFGSAFEKDDIVCLWNGGIATAFSGQTDWENGKGTIIFVESEFKGEITELYNVLDITEDYKENLKELKEFAEKIGYKYFGRSFDMAYRLLDNSVTPNYDGIPHYMKDLPERMKTIMMVRHISYVFGGMGSWNDDPAGVAQSMGIKDEYERLTNELILNQRKALFYVTNEC